MFEWNDNNTITVTPPARPKKLTATRFAAVLDKNVWESPFSVWCAVTRTYEPPFEDTIYTNAGKAIEPKQLDYCKKTYFMNVKTPTDVYGANYFNKTFGDFFPNEKIFGGMWDSLVVDENGKPTKVIECKTTKRAEDWEGGKIPEYYAMQAALYAYLLGVDDVIMVASFLDESDYDHPENFKPSVKNTILVPFKVSEKYPKFKTMLKDAETWWHKHVDTGISPVFDEKRDADYLKALRTKHIDTATTDISDIIGEIETLTDEINAHDAEIKEKSERLKTLQDTLKKQALKQFRDGDKSVVIDGDKYTFTVTKATTQTVDKAALETDGLLTKYIKCSESYKLTSKKKEL
jgi:predicted phage-related endonuclease